MILTSHIESFDVFDGTFALEKTTLSLIHSEKYEQKHLWLNEITVNSWNRFPCHCRAMPEEQPATSKYVSQESKVEEFSNEKPHRAT